METIIIWEAKEANMKIRESLVRNWSVSSDMRMGWVTTAANDGGLLFLNLLSVDATSPVRGESDFFKSTREAGNWSLEETRSDAT
jgi:hypothetical protein